MKLPDRPLKRDAWRDKQEYYSQLFCLSYTLLILSDTQAVIGQVFIPNQRNKDYPLRRYLKSVKMVYGSIAKAVVWVPAALSRFHKNDDTLH